MKLRVVARLFVYLLLFLGGAFVFPRPLVHAVCPGYSINQAQPIPPHTPTTFTFDTKPYNKTGGVYIVKFQCFGFVDQTVSAPPDANGIIRVTPDASGCAFRSSTQGRYAQLLWSGGVIEESLCSESYLMANQEQGGSCSLTLSPSSPTTTSTILVTVQSSSTEQLYLHEQTPTAPLGRNLGTVENGKTYSLTNNGAGTYKVWLEGNFGVDKCNKTFSVNDPGGASMGTGKVDDLCVLIQDPTEKTNCTTCVTRPGGLWTALGCLETATPGAFIAKLLTVGISIAGGIAFLLILFGGFQILTSAGNPEQLAAGQELVASAVTGLLLVIFSVFILRIVGVNILSIPEFLPA